MKYEEENLIAEGATTAVYQATAPDFFGQKVAIKRLLEEYRSDPMYRGMLRSEAQHLARLSHPNLVRIFAYVGNEEEEFSVLEYVEGWNLREIIQKHQAQQKKIKEWFSLFVLLKVCEALNYLHAQSLVHGDLNPKNILLSKGGHLKLIDLSIAQSPEAKIGKERRVGKGSVSYMAPEQAEGKAMNAPSDLFSLGVILYELLVGKKPFEGRDQFEVKQRVQTQEIEEANFPRAFNPHLMKILLKLLAKDPQDRYPSAFDLWKALSPHLHLQYPGLIPHDIAEYLEKLFIPQEKNP